MYTQNFNINTNAVVHKNILALSHSMQCFRGDDMQYIPSSCFNYVQLHGRTLQLDNECAHTKILQVTAATDQPWSYNQASINNLNFVIIKVERNIIISIHVRVLPEWMSHVYCEYFNHNLCCYKSLTIRSIILVIKLVKSSSFTCGRSYRARQHSA